MIFKTTPRHEWRRWFAWRPVMLTDNTGRIVWLEHVERWYGPHSFVPEQYRLPWKRY